MDSRSLSKTSSPHYNYRISTLFEYQFENSLVELFITGYELYRAITKGDNP